MEDRQQLWLVAIWRARFFLAAVFGCLVVLIGWWTLWRPLWNESAEIISRERKAKMNIERLNSELAERRAAKEILGTLSVSGRQKLSLLVQTRPETAELIRLLDHLTVEAGGVLESVDVNDGGEVVVVGGVREPPVKPPVGASQLLLQARINGMDYFRFNNLLKKLEMHLPLLLVDSFVISDKTPGIELGLHWFYFRPLKI